MADTGKPKGIGSAGEDASDLESSASSSGIAHLASKTVDEIRKALKRDDFEQESISNPEYFDDRARILFDLVEFSSSEERPQGTPCELIKLTVGKGSSPTSKINNMVSWSQYVSGGEYCEGDRYLTAAAKKFGFLAIDAKKISDKVRDQTLIYLKYLVVIHEDKKLIDRLKPYHLPSTVQWLKEYVASDADVIEPPKPSKASKPDSGDKGVSDDEADHQELVDDELDIPEAIPVGAKHKEKPEDVPPASPPISPYPLVHGAQPLPGYVFVYPVMPVFPNLPVPPSASDSNSEKNPAVENDEYKKRLEEGKKRGRKFARSNPNADKSEVDAEIRDEYGNNPDNAHSDGFRLGFLDELKENPIEDPAIEALREEVRRLTQENGEKDVTNRTLESERDMARRQREASEQEVAQLRAAAAPPVPRPQPSVNGWGPSVSRVRMEPSELRQQFNSVHGVTGGIWTHMMKNLTTDRSSGGAFNMPTPTPPPAPAPQTPPPAASGRQQNPASQPSSTPPSANP